MAKALLITTTDLKKYSVIDGNLDNDRFIQYIGISQDIHLQNYTGTDLLVKIQALITAGTIGDAGNEAYNTLLVTYLKPMLIHWAMVEYLPFAAYQIKNAGVLKHTSETSVSVDKNEVDFLIQRERDIAENYTRRFIDFMCYNSGDYPEYDSNTNEDVRPDKNTDFSGWLLGLLILFLI